MVGQSQAPIDDTTSTWTGDTPRSLSLSRVVATLQVVLATRRAARAAERASAFIPGRAN
jgi:hypothetical protein